MSSGGFYVTVEANEVTLMADEGPSDGGSGGTGGEMRYWIDWVTTNSEGIGDTGLSGVSWYGSDPNGPWVNTSVFGKSDDQIDNYIKTELNNNLNNILGDAYWANKSTFARTHFDDLYTAGCLTIL